MKSAMAAELSVPNDIGALTRNNPWRRRLHLRDGVIGGIEVAKIASAFEIGPAARWAACPVVRLRS
jgi:hypothetical protein